MIINKQIMINDLYIGSNLLVTTNRTGEMAKWKEHNNMSWVVTRLAGLNPGSQQCNYQILSLSL